ncbi:hypothetical protein GUJ93_ZPchr0012g21680 [Zizania palustris]|uniref:Uncharacterized protein n=1 Tax=Zizania palustris TaxID=103762 RepID=A0A8J5WNQ0_ZIZPA|nr:hypothetical protein GUJ93_ZPchr0012g21680 [Zizania palustris]
MATAASSSLAHRHSCQGDAATTMAAIDSIVLDPDAASVLHLTAHQYNQLFHLLTATNRSSFPITTAPAPTTTDEGDEAFELVAYLT